jgi:hypothetical protein
VQNFGFMQLLIGIDDTDNKDSRGTGFNARQMARLIEEAQLGKVEGITRHQLFFDPRIPYTSQNSSAALEVSSADKKIKDFCIEYLLKIAPEGCDIGLCIAPANDFPESIIDWGFRAKREVLTQDEAKAIASKTEVFLVGLTGTKDGIIGAMAAIGLRKSGNDGRFIWLKTKKELRDIKPGIHDSDILYSDLGIQSIENIEGNCLVGRNEIYLHDWVRPVLKDGKVTLLIEKARNEDGYKWKSANKDLVRSVS